MSSINESNVLTMDEWTGLLWTCLIRRSCQRRLSAVERPWLLQIKGGAEVCLRRPIWRQPAPLRMKEARVGVKRRDMVI
ncbi:hypothetical protein M378DRAFT_1003772 [Amanita muscaria Koide BX008]|uniref:Uncharacterized protein n=1 Tax=Amanita muscaria (strain Koide BX008) TaxID=946122 RepID=A0A0C2WS48_AMAMK|nr:hypothetical protein M378DRAFT_1003772 [Amanita muscaria Koide BX008]